MIAITSLPNVRFLGCFKFKAFADIKINVTEKLKYVFGRVENTMGNGENAGYQHFLLLSQYFQNVSFSGSLKVGAVL